MIIVMTKPTILLLVSKKNGGNVDPSDADSISDSQSRGSQPKVRRLDPHQIDMINEDWEDTDETSMMWEFISQGMIREFMAIVQEVPEIVHIRSADGRGPMWWAHEHKRPKIIELLKKLGVSEERKDKDGIRPLDL